MEHVILFVRLATCEHIRMRLPAQNSLRNGSASTSLIVSFFSNNWQSSANQIQFWTNLFNFHMSRKPHDGFVKISWPEFMLAVSFDWCIPSNGMFPVCLIPMMVSPRAPAVLKCILLARSGTCNGYFCVSYEYKCFQLGVRQL